MPLEFNPPTLSIFHTFKTKKDQLTGEALRQRSIISLLATEKNSATKTRTAISQSIGKKNGMITEEPELFRRKSELDDIPDDFAARMMEFKPADIKNKE